jgi:kynurenine formamidase
MGAAHDGATAHVEGLSRGAAFIECLANLDSLPVLGAQFIFLPIRILRASGAPGRAIALVGAAG